MLDGEALALLYAMASDPARSSDALRLLQELQVYQVELDLQRAQLESNEREMSRELVHYRALFALTPSACLVVAADGYIVDANPAAAALMGAACDDLAGRLLVDFLGPQSHAPWNRLLAQLKAGEQGIGGEVIASNVGDEPGLARLSVSISPEGDALLLTLASREPAVHDPDSSRQSY
ncbi:MAG: PAS domain-containing protein [Chromatocurvus sp.]